jgi:RNA polymerase sigma-32 factor
MARTKNSRMIRWNSDSSVEQYFKWVTRQPMMSPKEELEIAQLWRDSGNLKYQKRLVNANLRFVAKVAYEYENYGFAILDLIQEGNMGLVRAIESFDPAKGYRLISYAVWWIRACIHDYILKNWSLVKLGTTQRQRAMFNRLVSAKKRLDRLTDGGDVAYRADIAKSVGASTGEVREFEQRMRNRPVHLDERVGKDSERDTTYHELLADEQANTETLVVDEHLAQQTSSVLHEALEKLPERERNIVVSRHLSTDKATFRELGAEMGVSKERVRQLEARALSSLRQCLSSSPEVAELLAA